MNIAITVALKTAQACYVMLIKDLRRDKSAVSLEDVYHV